MIENIYVCFQYERSINGDSLIYAANSRYLPTMTG